MKFDLQLFAEPIPGIDADILKELGVDEETSPETSEPKEEPAPVPAEPDTNSSAEADSVTKQVENTEDQDEYDDLKDSKTIPYDRFKSVNDRRKIAENRIKELEEKLKGFETRPQEPQPAPQNSLSEYSAEQREKICELAMQRVKERLNYSDEDIDAMEYADDPKQKIMYNAELAREIDKVSSEIQAYKRNQEATTTMYGNNSKRFEELLKKIEAYPDSKERIQFLITENFSKLDKEKQGILNEAYARLQAKQGTNADYRLLNSYFAKANKIWEEAHSSAPAPKQNSKITQVQRLPKAPNINGGGGGDKVYTIAELTEIINSPGGWESLPEKVKQDIMKGKLPV